MDVRGWADGAEASGDGAAGAARMAFAAAGMGWWRWDPATGQVWWSPELERLYGLEPGSFAGDMAAYTEGIHPDDRDAVAAVIDRAVAEQRDFTMEHRRIRPDGDVRWIEGRGAPILDERRHGARVGRHRDRRDGPRVARPRAARP